MLHILNRAELYLTHSLTERSRICDILSANGIEYVTKTVNLSSPGIFSGRSRENYGTMGMNTDYLYEYHIYVHNKQLDHALHLIANHK